MVFSCSRATPLPCHLGGSPTATCLVPPHPSLTTGMLSEKKRKHQAVKMDSCSCWQPIYITSSFTVLWCILENCPVVQLATREHKAQSKLWTLQIFHQASALYFFVTAKNPAYQFQSLPTLQLLLIELWLRVVNEQTLNDCTETGEC